MENGELRMKFAALEVEDLVRDEGRVVDGADGVDGGVADEVVDADVAWILVVGRAVEGGAIELVLVEGGAGVGQAAVLVFGEDDEGAVLLEVKHPLGGFAAGGQQESAGVV